jgi:hypothetical protein
VQIARFDAIGDVGVDAAGYFSKQNFNQWKSRPETAGL